MGKLVVSLDGVVIKEVQITKDKTTLGRRPYNDIVIDNLAVSGEHAVLQMLGNDVFIEDLNSTNGTYINGKAIKKQLLTHNDTVEIGKYKIKFLHDAQDASEMRVAAAPAPAAARADAPILLIHGRDDTVVPIEQSRVMSDALKAAGKHHRLVELLGEDHWLSRAETRIRMLQETVRFLEMHNPPG